MEYSCTALCSINSRYRGVIVLDSMGSDPSSLSPVRDQTDESLRTERTKTDEVLAEARESIEKEEDLIVQRARDTADTVLETARDKADKQLNTPVSATATHATIEQARNIEDEALLRERALADATLEHQRSHSTNALKRLLPLEREKTDRTLLTERAHSDSAVSQRDDFLGMVCHDLRDLLGGILLTSESLADHAAEGAAGDAIRSTTQQIERYSARMNRLISDLVDVASIDAGQLAISTTQNDTALLVQETVQAFQQTAAPKQISLSIIGDLPPLFTSFDHDRMLQVLANVLSNAIKFTQSGGHITISREVVGTDIVFAVKDTGTGIPADKLEAVFDRFWQLGKNDRRGIGLGLYISKCIVESHGGKMWVESTPGEGSTFYFTVPKK